MISGRKRPNMPRTVDEAAELLISDLLIQHLKAFSKMSEDDFDLMCEKVTPYLLEEFQLWQGNDLLLESCLATEETEFDDPARIILESVKRKLRDLSGFLVIT
jgi:hypothetical protein